MVQLGVEMICVIAHAPESLHTHVCGSCLLYVCWWGLGNPNMVKAEGRWWWGVKKSGFAVHLRMIWQLMLSSHG